MTQQQDLYFNQPLSKKQLFLFKEGLFSQVLGKTKYVQIYTDPDSLTPNDLYRMDLSLVDQGYVICDRKVVLTSIFVSIQDPFDEGAEPLGLEKVQVKIVEYKLKKYQQEGEKK